MIEETAFPYRIGPKYIPDFCRTPEEMKAWLDKHLSTSKVVYKKIVPIKPAFTQGTIELRLYTPEANKKIFFVTLDGVTIHYVMELHKMTASSSPISPLPTQLTRRLCYQASVWRSIKLQQADQSFVKTVFWKYLVSPTRTVVSDSSQSDQGEAFWSNRIVEAIDDPKFKVYGLWCDKSGNTLEIEGCLEVTDVDQMKQFYTEAEDYNGHFMRLAIVKV